MEEILVRVNKYAQIPELPVLARIEVDHHVIVRDTVARKLSKVSNALPQGINLRVDSGYRSRRTHEIIWGFRLKQNLGNEHKTKQLVFNPRSGIPPHTTGGAIDVSLVDNSGKEINLSEPFTKYYQEPKLRSKRITKKAQELRLLLNEVMIKNGFAPNPREYWHFSYGDAHWGAYYKKKAIYSEIKIISKRLIYPLHLRILYRAKRRAWQFVRKLIKLETNY